MSKSIRWHCRHLFTIHYLLLTAFQEHKRRGQNNIENCGRQQKLPAKIHQLIKTKSWQCAAQPNVKKQKDQYLGKKAENTDEREKNSAATKHISGKWNVPAAPEQRRRQHRHGDHVDVFGVEKE